MRYVFAALVLAAGVFATAAQAEKRVFIIANNSDGYGVDRCLATGASCGAAVATAYCQSRNYAASASFLSDDRQLRARSIRRHRVLALGPLTTPRGRSSRQSARVAFFLLTRVTRIFEKSVLTKTAPATRAECRRGLFVAQTPAPRASAFAVGR